MSGTKELLLSYGMAVYLNDMFSEERLEETAEYLNPNVILMATNISRDVTNENIPWQNFHLMPHDDDNYPNNTTKTGIFTRGCYRNSFLWGAYFTDFVKNLVNGKAKIVISWLKRSPEAVNRNFAIFKNEIGWLSKMSLNNDPMTVIILGRDIYQIFLKNRDILTTIAEVIGRPLRIGWIGHYSGVRYYRAKQKKTFDTLRRQMEIYRKQIDAMQIVLEQELGTIDDKNNNITWLNEINATRTDAPDEVLYDPELLRNMFKFR